MERQRHDIDIEAELAKLVREARPSTFESALHARVEELLRMGYPRDYLYEDLERLRSGLLGRGREDLEEGVLEVMDALSGWCAPSARI